MITDLPIDILLVEDNPDDVELSLHSFEQHGLSNRIFVVNDGVDALDFLFADGKYRHRDRYDLPKVILLDLKLPRLDGLEVLRTIRETELTRTLPVVVLTTSSEERDVVETYALGVNSYIVKPVDFERFTAVARLLGFYWLSLNRPPLAPSGGR